MGPAVPGTPGDMTETEQRALAVVTGASSGIGFELAKQFAEHGYDLLVCAEDAEIEQAAAELRESGADVTALQADLATYDGVETLYAATTVAGRPVSAVALNAGVGLGGPFLETELAREIAMIDLNITGTIHLAKRLLPDMVARDAGSILVTSSVASTMPGSYQSVYNATKSFLQSWTQAVQEELKDTGVVLTSLMPGPTETDFFHRAEMDDTPVGKGKKDDPAKVARQGFEALMDAEDKVLGGSLKSRAQGTAAKVLPDRLKAKMHSNMAEPEDA
jgi:short-subunit dehydrogenase